MQGQGRGDQCAHNGSPPHFKPPRSQSLHRVWPRCRFSSFHLTGHDSAHRLSSRHTSKHALLFVIHTLLLHYGHPCSCGLRPSAAGTSVLEPIAEPLICAPLGFCGTEGLENGCGCLKLPISLRMSLSLALSYASRLVHPSVGQELPSPPTRDRHM